MERKIYIQAVFILKGSVNCVTREEQTHTLVWRRGNDYVKKGMSFLSFPKDELKFDETFDQGLERILKEQINLDLNDVKDYSRSPWVADSDINDKENPNHDIVFSTIIGFKYSDIPSSLHELLVPIAYDESIERNMIASVQSFILSPFNYNRYPRDLFDYNQIKIIDYLTDYYNNRLSNDNSSNWNKIQSWL